ncbi:T9SS response regulator signal transducer PorX [Aureibacter tunicatorum]|uniref:CheY-like chemotaxis protein n=1 Tax=Aureibacter tunicatorum TaxID=866807 RepID=A0AAE3XT14_9BACT|nr:bifunctional response regulator/alkaline phosphatase family protein [Aureibacter tunicatorum]MDR6242062.1 CheY-like chemotaxis protein [Aureibacter tunicatorum]BDD03637.1 two-component system response regulator [Aureibacter tunicatorum]
MQTYHIFWADDEIELLKPHILFLEKKGYTIHPFKSATEVLDALDEANCDIIFLDENMPGMTGLEAIPHIKEKKPNTPIIMITKSEEEHIMEEAIASKISDYLIKPLNPNQILLAIKKLTENKRLVSERTNMSYQQDFRNISMAFSDYMDHEEWTDIYNKLIFWELEIEQSSDNSMSEVLEMQKTDANVNFTKFIKENYVDWLNDPEVDKPLLSHQIMKEKVFPHLKNSDQPVFFVVIDNLRSDQWKVLQPIFNEYFNTEEESSYFSILPTTTAYSRNSIFSGMLPLEMSKHYPDLWEGEDSDEGKNNAEDAFLERQLRRNNLDIKWSYHKIKQLNQGKQLADNINNLMNNQLNVIVYNFVDMLSHARTEMEVIRELAPNESAYRSLTKSWFMHSPLLEIFQKLAKKDVKVVLTTDHGTMRVKKPYKIIGDRNTNTNLRYKQGKNLSFDEDKVFVARDPKKFHLPQVNVSTAYVFSTEDYFFAYPNNYNYYVNYYKDTFQHGGVSLEEMIIPLVTLQSKNGK